MFLEKWILIQKIGGVDRDIHIKHDEKGDFIEWPECGAKHKVKYYPIKPGEGIQWSIDGLRDKKWLKKEK